MTHRLAVAAFVLATLVATAAAAAETRRGQYVWTGGSQGPVEAVFTPAGDGRWTVDFHFTFDGVRHVYSGEASGSLTDGRLAGRVTSDRGRRVFTFEGTVRGGAFRGTHAEGTERTGTLTLGL